MFSIFVDVLMASQENDVKTSIHRRPHQVRSKMLNVQMLASTVMPAKVGSIAPIVLHKFCVDFN